MPALAVLGLLAVTALGARGLPSRVMSRGDPIIDLASPVVGQAIVIVTAVMAVAVLLFVFWPGQRGPLPPRPKISFVRMLVAMLAFAVVLSVLRFALPEPGEEVVVDAPAVEQEDVAAPRWGVILLAGALAVTLFALLTLGGRAERPRRLRDEDLGSDGPPAGPAPGGAVPATVALVISDEQHRRRVIELYAAMLADLERHGLGRRPHEAPAEYVARIGNDPRVSGDALEALTELFGRAGFSTHPIVAATVADAGAALARARTPPSRAP